MLLIDALRSAELSLAAHIGRKIAAVPINANAPEQESFVFRADLADQGSLIVKVAAPGRLSAQFSRLATIHPLMKDGLFRVPRPVAYDDRSGVLLMEDAWGMAAQTLWLNGGPAAQRTLAAAGGWLARYHRLSASTAAFNPNPHLNWLRKSLSAHHEGRRLIPQMQDLTAHLPQIESLAESAGAVTSVRCVTHRDFHLRNLLIRKHGRTYGIDMENAGRDDALRDLMFFLTDLARSSLQDPTPAALQSNAGKLRLAYGRSPADAPARLFFQRCFALNLWAALDQSSAPWSARHQRSLDIAQAILQADDLFVDPTDPPDPAPEGGRN